MKISAALSSALLLSYSSATQEHPIQKVLELLDDLMTKAEEEGKAEALSFQKMEYWCKNSVKTVKKAIKKEKSDIESLEAKIEAKQKEKTTLEEQIEDLEGQISDLETKGTEADTARKDANDLWKEADSDFDLTVEGIDQAIEEIEGAKSFAQVQTQVTGLIALLEVRASQQQREKLEALIATDPKDVKAKGDQESHVKKYNFKSDNVVELLKEMKLMFEDEKTVALKEETNAANSYNLEKDARDNAIEAATKSKNEKNSELNDCESDLAEAQGDLEDTEGELEADSATLESTEETCSTRDEEWAARSKTRENEIEAMATAKKILAKVGNVRHEQPDNPVPPPSPTEFLGLHSGSLRGLSLLQLETDPKMKALNFLRQKAQIMHSKEMERLAQQVKAHLGGPFTEVNDMIMKMIFRLEAEQKDEDIHKNWCDQEIDKTEDTIEAKGDKIEELSTTIDEDEARVQELSNELTDAEEMVAEIVKFMADATEVREIGTTENAKAIKDAQDAQKAISQAIQVLEDFYKESGEVPKEPYEFVQKGGGVDLPDKPAMWDASYTGVSDPKSQPGGIVSVLEESSADFASMEAETKAEEAEDQKVFQEDMSTHRTEKSKRDKEIQAKTEEKKATVDNVAAMKKMKKNTKDAKEAAEKYEKELQPACVDGDSTYEDRKEARTSEIEGLREAAEKIKDAFKEDGDAKLVQTPAKTSFLQRD